MGDFGVNDHIINNNDKRNNDMNMTAIKDSVAFLEPRDRASLAKWIISTLDSAGESNADKSKNDRAWRREVRMRVDDIRDGRVQMIDSQTLWDELLSEYETQN
jgi:hypothetical protein